MQTSEAVGTAIGGVIGIVVVVFLFVVALAWLILPLVIISKLDKLQKLAENSNVLLNIIANHTREKPETFREGP